MVLVRRFKPGEEMEMVELFRHTVHRLNSRDYSPEQVAAWAPDDLDLESACEKIRANNPFVAVHNDKIIGFADIQSDGYIDQFFCHHEYAGIGIGKKLFAAIRQFASENGITAIHANVSITARPFFESLGFVVERKQEVTLRGQSFINFNMALDCGKS